ncbi:hypothetical protein YC2023_083162 [Brassica napus]
MSDESLTDKSDDSATSESVSKEHVCSSDNTFSKALANARDVEYMETEGREHEMKDREDGEKTHKTTTPDLYLLNTRQTQDYKTTTTARLQDNNNSSRDLSNSSTMVNTRQTQDYNTVSPDRNTHLSQSSTLVTSPTAAQ